MQRGDREAGEAFVRRWWDPVAAYCRRRIRPPLEVDDLVQESLVAILCRLEHKRPATPFVPWAYAVARSVVVDACRAAKRRPVCVPWSKEAADSAAAADPPNESAAERAAAELWALAGEVLTDRQLEVLRLRFQDGLRVTAIAAATGLTVVHVKVLLYRARRRLLEAWRSRKREATVPGIGVPTIGRSPS